MKKMAINVHVVLQMCLMTLAIVAFMAVPGKAVTQEDVPVRLEIKTPTHEILPFQPLRLFIEAKAERSFKGAFEYGRMILYISSPKSEYSMNFNRMKTGLAIDSFPDAKGKEYSQDYIVNGDELVLYDFRTKEYIFTLPATYKIKVAIDIFVGDGLDSYKPIRIESNSIEVHVLAPKREEDVAARLWKKQPPEEGPEINMTNALSLVNFYPKTSYAQYARFYLSSNEKLGIVERTKLLNDFISTGPPAQLTDRAFLELARISHEQGNHKEGHTYAEKVLNLPAASKKSKDEASDLLGGTKRKAEK